MGSSYRIKVLFLFEMLGFLWGYPAKPCHTWQTLSQCHLLKHHTADSSRRVSLSARMLRPSQPRCWDVKPCLLLFLGCFFCFVCDPSKIAILRTYTPLRHTGSFTLPLEGSRVLRVDVFFFLVIGHWPSFPDDGFLRNTPPKHMHLSTEVYRIQF